MKDNKEETPPASVNGDEVIEMYYEEVEEVQLEDLMEDESDEDEKHSSLRTFDKHEGSVFCCDLHYSGIYAVTGGEDDNAYVWDTQTGQVLMECTGHTDSVIFVGFSYDGAYVATVDMSGMIKVWKCNFGVINVIWPVVFEYEAGDLSWALWHFSARVLICGAITGDVFVFKIPSGNTKVLQGHNKKSECGKLFQDGKRLAVGYEDGAVKVWDLKSASVLHQVPAGVHTLAVTAIDIHPEDNLMASTSADGLVLLTTSHNGKVVGRLEAEEDLETVAFPPDPDMGYIALGTLTGGVSVWDLSRQMLRHHCVQSSEDGAAGVTKMIWVKNHLLTGCLDGSLRIYEGNSGARTLKVRVHKSEILDFCYNKEQNFILTASDDGTARIFKYEESEV